MPSALAIVVAAAASGSVYVYGPDGNIALFGSGREQAQTVTLPSSTCFLAVLASDNYGPAAILVETSTGVVTDASWKCSAENQRYWYEPWFDDSSWSNARIVATNGDGGWHAAGISTQAKWIWADVTTLGSIYCRKTFC